MSNCMAYKDYLCTIEYSSEDEVFHGKIEGIDDLVTFEGQSVPELKIAFYEAVDDYIDTCKQLNKKPLKSYNGSFNVRISPELHRKAIKKALSEGVSLNKIVERAISGIV